MLELAAQHAASISIMLLQLVWAECILLIAPITLELELAALHSVSISFVRLWLEWMAFIPTASVTSWPPALQSAPHRFLCI